ncbi:scyllo-inositol 2-dehydrogenase (NADP(+)) IolW [Paenibacillus allorhizoplanae]|uniref:Scyllo-inositol 2-dehydrogenase (NADP(+)) IolW n=1 Tax=Paenibacillus allorhizoplanae TaxID=2905648 RepID=A0ABM9CQA5_9BACL|nr:Gfo/Idh/MocA family oxidoreductase [Paenibacillus allorhizoplanae]CAH1221376.1 scyllo-inositol 2-dehydrogenase (NADP(+)) IolW [Paenibacillus allorhizoplanae]
MKKWGIGLIGCGSIADVHLEALRGIDHARIVAVASRNEQRARETSDRYACGWTTDYQEILENRDIDIVCITTGSGSHGRIGTEALQAGKHVLVEKPIAMSANEASSMIRLANEKQLTLSVVSQTRFFPHHQLLKQTIEDGQIGNLLLVEVSRPFYRSQAYYDEAAWRGTKANDGGALLNQGIHSIDLLLWLAGKVRSVAGRAATQTHHMESEDMGLAMLTMENGGFATLMCTTSAIPGFPPSINVYGEKGTIKIVGQEITHWTVPGILLPNYENDNKSGNAGADPRNLNSAYHRMQIIDFIESVSQKRKPAVTAEAGREAVRLIELIHRSSEQGGIPISFDL